MTDDEPEQSQVQNKRPDRFGYIFRGGEKYALRRPLTMEKLIDGSWTKMALLRIPLTDEDARYPRRLADALGGLVRIRKGENTLEEWEDGIVLRGQTRCA